MATRALGESKREISLSLSFIVGGLGWVGTFVHLGEGAAAQEPQPGEERRRQEVDVPARGQLVFAIAAA